MHDACDLFETSGQFFGLVLRRVLLHPPVCAIHVTSHPSDLLTPHVPPLLILNSVQAAELAHLLRTASAMAHWVEEGGSVELWTDRPGTYPSKN